MQFSTQKITTIFLVILLSALSALSSQAAKASLIGDTVYGHDAQYYAPGIYGTKDGFRFLDGIEYDVLFDATEIGPIVSGDADAIMVPFFGGPLFDFEETGFTLSLNSVYAQWGEFDGNFNGIAITDIDYSPSSVISGFTLTNEMYLNDGTLVAFTPGRVSYTDHSVFLDFHGLSMFD
jgi:hypothetical protein